MGSLLGDIAHPAPGDANVTAPAVVDELVERFDSHQDVYRSDQYNEAQRGEEFLNPYFKGAGRSPS